MEGNSCSLGTGPARRRGQRDGASSQAAAARAHQHQQAEERMGIPIYQSTISRPQKLDGTAPTQLLE